MSTYIAACGEKPVVFRRQTGPDQANRKPVARRYASGYAWTCGSPRILSAAFDVQERADIARRKATRYTLDDRAHAKGKRLAVEYRSGGSSARTDGFSHTRAGQIDDSHHDRAGVCSSVCLHYTLLFHPKNRERFRGGGIRSVRVGLPGVYLILGKNNPEIRLGT